MELNKFERISFKIAIPLLALILIYIHAFHSKEIKIDQTTLWLIVIILIPFLSNYLNTLRVGDLELNFKSLDKEEQIFVFLKSLSKDALPTFYKPRPGESELGIVGKHLVKDLIRTNPAKLTEEVGSWIISDDKGLKWLASEIVGFFDMQELSIKLANHYDTTKNNIDWEAWKLNYLWAHSKVDNNFQEIDEFLLNTTSEYNQIWLFDVYYQMSEEDPTLQSMFCSKAENILKSKDLSDKAKKMLINTISNIKGLRDFST